MPKPNRPFAVLLLAALAAASFGAATARAEPSSPESTPPPLVSAMADPWAASFAGFDAADRSHTPPPGGVVFVGSSTIRMWNSLETDFKALPVVLNRGFGGSTLSDCVHHLDKLVVAYHPRMVLVYAGDNDLAEGRKAEDILDRFKAFAAGVRQALPRTRISFISIKPSPARVSLLGEIRRANALVRDYVATIPNTDFIDVYASMIASDGAPRPELFSADALHMNAAGYALWRSTIAPYVLSDATAGAAPRVLSLR